MTQTTNTATTNEVADIKENTNNITDETNKAIHKDVANEHTHYSNVRIYYDSSSM